MQPNKAAQSMAVIEKQARELMPGDVLDVMSKSDPWTVTRISNRNNGMSVYCYSSRDGVEHVIACSQFKKFRVKKQES